MADRYDMVVLGAGPAGEKGAAQAAYWGKKVAVVERERECGGAMVQGAISTKTLREAALYLTGFRRRDVYGVSLDLTPERAIERLRHRTDRVVANLDQAVHENLRRHGIDLIQGEGSLGPDHSVVVRRSDGGPPRTVGADVVLIATGSRPFHPPGVPFDDPDVLDSDAAQALDRPLRDLVVVGGGAVGCELASIFTALGTEVTLVDSGPRLLPFMDAEISQAFAGILRLGGGRWVQGAGRAAVSRSDGGIQVDLASGESVAAEKVVFATGRAGNTENLGLEEAGVETDDRGRIVVDGTFRTTAEGVYAAGDVIGPPALASVSMEQGRVAACYAFDIPFKRTVDPSPPFGVYSIPEIASVGMTEEQAADAGEDAASGRALFDQNSRAAIAGTTEGMIKVVFRRDDLRILGIHVVGDSATELVHQGQAVMNLGGTLEYFIHATFNVPTLSEAYKYAAYDGLRAVGR